LILCLIATAACAKRGPAVTVSVNGQAVAIAEIDTTTDTLLDSKPSDDIDFEMERSIFRPLLDAENPNPVLHGSIIEITVPEPFDIAILYDHLLREGGTSYYNRAIKEHPLEFAGGKATITLAPHFSAMLSSNSEFLKDGSIRGFRLVLKNGDTVKEYAFVIYVTGGHNYDH